MSNLTQVIYIDNVILPVPCGVWNSKVHLEEHNNDQENLETKELEKTGLSTYENML